MNTTDGGGSDPERVGWVSPPGGRSTWGILWSCFTVFLICSWKCTHLNLPSPRESCAGWRRWRGLPVWPSAALARKWWRKLLWMSMMALAPEVVVSIAVKQFLEARDALKRAGQGRFTLTHAFFALMGGFVLRVYIYEHQELQQAPGGTEVILVTKPEQAHDAPSVGTAESPCHGVTSADEIVDAVENWRPPRIIIVKEQMLNLVELCQCIAVFTQPFKPSNSTNLLAASLRYVDFPAHVTAADIEDRSKADSFSKAFAVCQSGWIVIQSIARAVRGLAITELELMTVAFVFCAIPAYLFWWHKPFDAERRHVIMCHASTVLEHNSKTYRNRAISPITLRPGPTEILPDEDDSRINDVNTDGSDDWLSLMFTYGYSDLARTMALYLVGAAFSAIHLGAWNWQFPSLLVQQLWRTFGTIAVATALACVPLVFIRRVYSKGWSDKFIADIFDRLVFGLFCLQYVVYFVSRLALLGLTFYCFTAMPPSVYADLDWTAFLPHFS